MAVKRPWVLPNDVKSYTSHKEVSERYEFMSGQLSDINSSKRELEKLIDELTETMKTRFAESFKEINANFKRIFTELFGGGRAAASEGEGEIGRIHHGSGGHGAVGRGRIRAQDELDGVGQPVVVGVGVGCRIASC